MRGMLGVVMRMMIVVCIVVFKNCVVGWLIGLVGWLVAFLKKYIFMCVCVCVCVWMSERGREILNCYYEYSLYIIIPLWYE